VLRIINEPTAAAIAYGLDKFLGPVTNGGGRGSGFWWWILEDFWTKKSF
jgi:hypothetical protein